MHHGFRVGDRWTVPVPKAVGFNERDPELAGSNHPGTGEPLNKKVGLVWEENEKKNLCLTLIAPGDSMIRKPTCIDTEGITLWIHSDVCDLEEESPDSCAKQHSMISNFFTPAERYRAMFVGPFCEGIVGQPGLYAAGVLSTDVDLDTDNDSTAMPQRISEEDDFEEIVEQALENSKGIRPSSLIVCVNKGYEEGKRAQCTEDFEVDGILNGVNTDPDLVRGVIVHKLPPPPANICGTGPVRGKAVIEYDESEIKVYVVRGGDYALIPSGKLFPVEALTFVPATVGNPFGNFQKWGERNDIIVEGLKASDEFSREKHQIFLKLIPDPPHREVDDDGEIKDARDLLIYTVVEVDATEEECASATKIKRACIISSMETMDTFAKMKKRFEGEGFFVYVKNAVEKKNRTFVSVDSGSDAINRKSQERYEIPRCAGVEFSDQKEIWLVAEGSGLDNGTESLQATPDDDVTIKHFPRDTTVVCRKILVPLKVSLLVNESEDEEDDFVCTDPGGLPQKPHTVLKIKVEGFKGNETVTVNLSVVQDGDGAASLSSGSVAFTPGNNEKEIMIFGNAISSKKNDVIIEARVSAQGIDNRLCAVQDVTVVGMKINVNETTDQKDDFVCLGQGGTLEIILDGPPDVETMAFLKTRQEAPEQITFSDDMPVLSTNQSTTVEIIGVTTSDDVNDVIIEAGILSLGDAPKSPCAEEDLTVVDVQIKALEINVIEDKVFESGDFLCKGQSQTLTFTAETIPVSFDPSLLSWEIDPSQAGKFSGKTDGQITVIWNQNDNFTSEEENDIDVKLFIGGAECALFEFTIVEVKGSTIKSCTSGASNTAFSDPLVKPVPNIPKFNKKLEDFFNKTGTIDQRWEVKLINKKKGQKDPKASDLFSSIVVSLEGQELKFTVTIKPNAKAAEYDLIRTGTQHKERVILFRIQYIPLKRHDGVNFSIVDQSTGEDVLKYSFQVKSDIKGEVDIVDVELLDGATQIFSGCADFSKNETNPRIFSGGNVTKRLTDITIPKTVANGKILKFKVTVTVKSSQQKCVIHEENIEVNNDAVNIARILCAEAADQGEKGQEAVASVLTNRVKFTFLNFEYSRSALKVPATGTFKAKLLGLANTHPTFARPVALEDTTESCRIVGKKAINQTLADTTKGSLYFYATGLKPQNCNVAEFLRDMVKLKVAVKVGTIGGNVFHAPPAKLTAAQMTAARAVDPNDCLD